MHFVCLHLVRGEDERHVTNTVLSRISLELPELVLSMRLCYCLSNPERCCVSVANSEAYLVSGGTHLEAHRVYFSLNDWSTRSR